MVSNLTYLSVVIPAYNEGKRLGPTLKRVMEFLSEQEMKWEIVVVNDGSTDNTTQIAEEAFAAIGTQGRILQNPGNRGKGFSVRHGMLEAHGEWILMSDADLSTPIEEVLLLAERATNAEVIIGSRGMKESQLEERQPFYRETMGRIFNLMVQTIALPGIRDSQCGFKLFRKDAASAVFSQSTIDGFGFDVESLFLAKRLGYSIAEVPIRWFNDPSTTVDALRDSTRMATDLFRIRARHRGVKATKESS